MAMAVLLAAVVAGVVVVVGVAASHPVWETEAVLPYPLLPSSLS